MVAQADWYRWDLTQLLKLRQNWDAVYRQGEISDNRHAEVLSENAFLLPQKGRSLDLACGLGTNTRLLAAADLAVFAWDIPTVAVEKLQADADKQGLAIQAKQCAINKIVLRLSFQCHCYQSIS